MLIRKRSIFELVLPLVLIAFLGQGTRFIDVTHIALLRFAFLFVLFLFLLANKKIFFGITNGTWLFLLFIYLSWCLSTTLWSEAPLLSFSKSMLFVLMVTTLLSAGSAWVIKFGFERSILFLLPIMALVIFSGVFGGNQMSHSIDPFHNYGGLSGNTNNFGFLVAIAFPLFLFKCHNAIKNKKNTIFWLGLLLMGVYFLMVSYCRSALLIFFCVLSFFVLSLSFSKKFMISFLIFFGLIIVLLLMPLDYLVGVTMAHVAKGSVTLEKKQISQEIFRSRIKNWEKSYDQAMKGGIIGGGFSIDIGKKYASNGKVIKGAILGDHREKSNSQLAIIEETGLIGFALASSIVILFLIYAIPYYLLLREDEKLVFGLVLGTILGLLLESIVEAWWDSLGPEVVCFWLLVGVIFGMIYIIKSRMKQHHL